MSIGANIRQRRLELKLTQQELANAMGYKSRATIAKIESGENDVTQSKLVKFATILDTSVERLISGSDAINLPLDTPIVPLQTDNLENKNIVIILAGGKSSRNHQNIPNQFVTVEDKPIIVYSMEAYQHHPTIEDIYVVCLKGWESIVKAYAEKFKITKLRGILPAGRTGILSVKSGFDAIKSNYNDDDIIIFQESTRPMVSVEIISKLLQSCNALGSSHICMPMRNHLQFTLANHKQSVADRETTVEVQSPEAYKINILEKIFTHADKINHKLSESCGALLLHNIGYKVNFVEGNVNNIKILRQEDIVIFSALLQKYFF